MSVKRKVYKPVERENHSTIRIGDYLYMWGGEQANFPDVHNSEKKRSLSSVIEIFHLPTGVWEQKPTTGNPPLGIKGYASAFIGKEIFYFGGYCNHDYCYHNSLYSLNIDTFHWTEISPTIYNDDHPMMKAFCGMIAIKLDEEDYLAVIGGYGPTSDDKPTHGAHCNNCEHFDEIHLYKLSSGEWIKLAINKSTKERPPPLSYFSLTSISNDTAVLFGGLNPVRKTNKGFIVKFTKTSVNFSMFSNRKGVELWPSEKYGHSSALINSRTAGPHLLVIGGSLVGECWLLDIKKKLWDKLLSVPESVIGRSHNSLSVWSVTPITFWAIIFGGSECNNDTQVIELRYITDTNWSACLIPFDQYQDKIMERKRECEALQHQKVKIAADRLSHLVQQKEVELEKERRDKEQIVIRLQNSLQEKDRQLQYKNEQLQKHIQANEKELQEREKQLRIQLEQKEREAEHQLEKELQQAIGREENLLCELHKVEQQIQQSKGREVQLEQQLRKKQLQETVKKEKESWKISKSDVLMTKNIIGKGAWGEVRIAYFHGLKIAAKVLHETIISDYNLSLFAREMDIASRIRHPNLLQFIGAITEGSPIILTELMPTSLRKELEISGPLSYPAILSISLDVACALNYLHLFKPHPIIHRDVSSANVLLQPMGGYDNSLRAKLSDYGSANLQPLIGKTTLPGSPLYAAPEAINPRDQSPAMDVFSYGVLLLEMISCRLPLQTERLKLIDAIKRVSFKSLIQRCLIEEYKKRPTMNDINTELNETI